MLSAYIALDLHLHNRHEYLWLAHTQLQQVFEALFFLIPTVLLSYSQIEQEYTRHRVYYLYAVGIPAIRWFQQSYSHNSQISITCLSHDTTKSISTQQFSPKTTYQHLIRTASFSSLQLGHCLVCQMSILAISTPLVNRNYRFNRRTRVWLFHNPLGSIRDLQPLIPLAHHSLINYIFWVMTSYDLLVHCCPFAAFGH